MKSENRQRQCECLHIARRMWLTSYSYNHQQKVSNERQSLIIFPQINLGGVSVGQLELVQDVAFELKRASLATHSE